MSRIVVIGGLGNMGRRYLAILAHLGYEAHPIDLEESQRQREVLFQKARGVIIATPTPDHCRRVLEVVSLSRRNDIPILCEKPLTTDIQQLDGLLRIARRDGYNLQMVNQYKHLRGYSSEYNEAEPSRYGSHYRYFNSGRDGLAWNCINILGLSKGRCQLTETSPLWSCRINGVWLSLSDMDDAYITMVNRWVQDPQPNLDYIEFSHRKVHDFVSKHESLNRGAGTLNV